MALYSTLQRIVSEGGAMFERRGGGPPHWKEAMQLSCMTLSVSGPHSWAMRLLRKAALVQSSCSYCWLSRTFASALSLRGAASAALAAMIRMAARQPGSNFGMVVLRVAGSDRLRDSNRLAEMRRGPPTLPPSTIVTPPPTPHPPPLMVTHPPPP